MDHYLRKQDVAYWAAWWAGLFAFYLLLVAKLAWDESFAGLAAAAIAATAVTVTRTTGRLRYRPRLRWIGEAGSLPLHVLADCATVALALWRRLARREKIEGRFVTVSVERSGDDSASTARRAWSILRISLAPNSYVLAIDGRRGRMLVYQLVPSRIPSDHRGGKETPRISGWGRRLH